MKILVALAALVIPFLHCDDPPPDHGTELVYQLQQDKAPSREQMEKTRAVLARRLETLSIPGASVRLEATSGRIVVRVPGNVRLRQVKHICGRRGQLLFAPVDDPATAFLAERSRKEHSDGGHSGPGLPAGVAIEEERLPDGTPAWFLQSSDHQTLQGAIQAVASRLPAGGKLLPAEGRDPQGRTVWRTYLTSADAWPAGEHVEEAEVVEDTMTGMPQVQIVFDAEGKKDFAELTAGLVRKRLAIVLDGRVQSAPVVMERIPGGRAIITLGFTSDPETTRRQAEALAVTLQTGALPAPLEFLEENIYAPAAAK